MEIFGATFPLLVAILPAKFDPPGVQAMIDAFDAYYTGSQRYAVLNLTPKNGSLPSAKERKQITDWTDSPRIRELSKQYCVVSATVVANPLMRGMLTAMHWVWEPPIPVLAVSTVREGLNRCLDGLLKADIVLPRSAESLRAEAEAWLRARTDVPESVLALA